MSPVDSVAERPSELCQPPKSWTRPPQLKLPSGSVDCHVHVYGPAATYSPAPTRAFDVPDAPPSALKQVLDTLGVDKVVLVQPSGYGTDNSRHLDAARELGRPVRIVAAVRSDIEDVELDRLHGSGVRGIRYNIGHAGAVPISEMPLMARRIARLGWHIQLHVMDDGGKAPLAEMEGVLSDLPVDLVIDHMGSLRPGSGLEQPGFQALLRLVRGGHCWVKLSASYRMSQVTPPYLDMIPYVDALMKVNAGRMLWASDWPHVSFKGAMPNTTDLLDQMLSWIPDAALRHKVLVENPAVLYNF